VWPDVVEGDSGILTDRRRRGQQFFVVAFGAAGW
jgi:hypothetical protein